MCQSWPQTPDLRWRPQTPARLGERVPTPSSTFCVGTTKQPAAAASKEIFTFRDECDRNKPHWPFCHDMVIRHHQWFYGRRLSPTSFFFFFAFTFVAYSIVLPLLVLRCFLFTCSFFHWSLISCQRPYISMVAGSLSCMHLYRLAGFPRAFYFRVRNSQKTMWKDGHGTTRRRCRRRARRGEAKLRAPPPAASRDVRTETRSEPSGVILSDLTSDKATFYKRGRGALARATRMLKNYPIYFVHKKNTILTQYLP